MDWSAQQDAALKAVGAWLKAGEPQVFRLFGFAGTGKTTLARHVAQDVDGDVAFGAFTGKAASVMRAKGCTDALHHPCHDLPLARGRRGGGPVLHLGTSPAPPRRRT